MTFNHFMTVMPINPATKPAQVMIGKEAIAKRVAELGAEISNYYHNNANGDCYDNNKNGEHKNSKHKNSEYKNSTDSSYGGRELVLIGLLRGSVIFMADLCRHIQRPHELDFMTVSSYGDKTASTGEVKIIKDLDGDIKGKDVLIVEDIVDSGHTLSKVIELLQVREPNSIEICTLISKPSRREVDIFVKFLGFEMADKFIVGYGLDYNQQYRHLPYIGEIGL